MEFKGSAEFEEFWGYLHKEAPRGVGVVAAAYFDEELKEMLDRADRRSFAARIDDALALGLLTANEHHDLHVIRQLRNSFAHELRADEFDEVKVKLVESLKTWQIASSAYKYEDLFPTPRDRLAYVAGAFFVRLKHRAPNRLSPLPEPQVWDDTAFPSVTDR